MNSSCMKNTWRVDRGMAGSGKEKQIFYIGNSLVPVGTWQRPDSTSDPLVSVNITNRY
jgi:hypothetical protein